MRGKGGWQTLLHAKFDNSAGAQLLRAPDEARNVASKQMLSLPMPPAGAAYPGAGPRYLTPATRAVAARTAAFSEALRTKAFRPSALHTTWRVARLQGHTMRTDQRTGLLNKARGKGGTCSWYPASPYFYCDSHLAWRGACWKATLAEAGFSITLLMAATS